VGGIQSFFSQSQSQHQQPSGAHGQSSSGLPWDKISKLPIPGMSNLNKLESTISNFIPGGLSHGSRRELDDDPAGSG
jgi:hypothetical protein